MNLDRFNPLSMFLASNEVPKLIKSELLPNKTTNSNFQNGSIPTSTTAYEDVIRYRQKSDTISKPLEMSDWGIDGLNDDFHDLHDLHDFHENSSYTSSSYNPRHYKHHHHHNNPGDYYLTLHLMKSNTDILSQFIKHHYNFDSIQNKFIEKFKYNLITSTLLEDSMILSKNDQALNDILTILRENLSPQNFNFNLKFNYNLNSILIFINLIIHCIKNGCNVQIFKILFIQSLKLIRLHKLKLKLITKKNLNQTNQFLLSNYRINKYLIINLLRLKELHVYNFMNTQDDQILIHERSNLKIHLLSTLYFLNFHLLDAIAKLFDVTNSEIFEQYVNINNVNLSTLVNSSNQDCESPIDEVVAQISKFHQLRKLLICQLLSINEKSNTKSFFVYQLMDNLNLKQSPETQVCLNDKILLITTIFEQQVKHLEHFHSTFEKFQECSNDQKASSDFEDILELTKPGSESGLNTNLMGLIEKLDSISTNLKFFHKYNQSTKSITNTDELHEKLMIFSQFKDDLAQAKELYKLSINDLNNEIYLVERNSYPSSTDGSSIKSPGLDNREFNLKSFHNPSIKKRFSLPSTSSLDEVLLANSLGQSDNKPKEKVSNSSGRQYKRLSAGLGVGLLTVVEEKPDGNSDSIGSKFSDSLKQRVAHDDNYINILPPQTYETYNQSTFDQLSSNGKLKKYSINLRNSNRFSMNSMNSTVSGVTDLISSTQLTNYDDDNDDNDECDEHNLNTIRIDTKVSKEQLRFQLEESFSRIYNLENENKKLKQNNLEGVNLHESEKEQDTVEDSQPKAKAENKIGVENPLPANKSSIRKMKSQTMIMDGTFLNTLEQTLSSRPIN